LGAETRGPIHVVADPINPTLKSTRVTMGKRI
jgi:hypothetical protein